MQLKSLEIQGFKSFPDKTVLNFSKGITAIVGPNGSGKSNIADAVRWVMGETSSKTLRGVKMEDVIFDGTQARRSVGFAQVSLILDNSDGCLPVEYNEVVISRRFYRSGESEYYLNSSLVRLKDINDLLRNTGLGKDGYSIIGQGGITEIIAAKSTERRFLFEEAAGIAKFKYKKEESERKLSLTQENIQRLLDIINELKERLIPLEEQAAKARQYLNMREERKSLEAGLWIKTLASLADDLIKAEKTAEILKNDLNDIERALTENEEKTNKNTEEQNNLTEDIERLRANNRIFEDDIQNKNAQIMVAKNDIDYANRDISHLKEEIEGFKLNIRQLVTDKSKEENNLFEEEKAIGLLKSELQSILQNKNEKAGTEKEYYKKTELLKQQTELLSGEITTLRIKQEGSIQNTDNLEKLKISLSTDLSDCEERLILLQKSKEKGSEDIKKNEELLDENKNILKGYLLKSENNKKQYEKLNTENNSLKLSLSDKQNRLKMLEDMEKNYEGFTGSIHMLMNEVKKGILNGICGTVASLIDVGGDYTLAIEIALGGAIQNIVTEDENSAKNGIYFLKSRNAGRATFLPLTSIKGNRLNIENLKNEEGFVGVSSELIKYDLKYKNIIEFLLGRTVITDNIDNAVEMAKKYKYTFKIVTLDGQVINAGGSMTGGSTARNIGILSRRNEVVELKKETEKLTFNIEKQSTILKNTINEISRVSALIEEINTENKSYEENLIKSRNDLLHYDQYLKNIEEQRKTLKNDIEDNELTLLNFNKILEETKLLLNEKQETSDKLKIALEEYESSNLLLKEEQEKIQDEIHRRNLEILEKTKNIENIGLKIIQLAERISSEEASILKNNDGIMTLELKINEYNDKILNIENEIKKLQDLSIETSADIKEKIDKRFAAEKVIVQLREEQKNLFTTKE
ncbi:MAG: chromosome segregation protein, partial [Clostridia bacterium]|nr:chromosome segregation protein [Clostridia bacterium]